MTPIEVEGNPFIFTEESKPILNNKKETSLSHNRTDTMPSLNAFLRKGTLYKQEKKTK